MKVLLINPPAENEILSCNPEFLEKERGHNPPLGILYLASYLEKQGDLCEISVMDAQAEEIGYPEIEERIRSYAPDIVGLTAMTVTLIDVLKVAGIVKKVDPGIRVVLGGPHPAIYPEETIGLDGIDFLVLGEGELILSELIANIDNREALRKIRGLVFKDNGTVVNTGEPDFVKDLDILPFPARHLVPYHKYTSLLAAKSPITTMFTSRGCPYRCTFCYRPNMGKVFRAVSAPRVVEEMRRCKEMGIKEIFLYDDTFSVNRKRVLEICRLIREEGLRIPWDIRTRVDNVDRELLAELKRSGCQRIHYGVESGNPRTLKILNKNINLDQVIEVFNMTRKTGITTFAYFMIGSPGETRDDILETIDFAKRLNPDYVQITIFTPFPGTEAYCSALKSGVIREDYWRQFARNPGKNFRTKYWEEILSGEELRGLLTYAYKQFYARPGYVIKRLAKLRSLEELKRKIRAGVRILKI